MSLPYNHDLIARAKELRKNMTPQERKLWYGFLNKASVRFQRQKTISGFIVDFYCAAARLVIELDGSQHFTEDGKAYDMERSAVLEEYGIRVVRYSNHDIDHSFSDVCEDIRNHIMTGLEEKDALH